MPTSTAACSIRPDFRRITLIEKLNGPWHEYSLWTYTVIVLSHWAEHLAQTTQIYLLGWSISDARGILGLWLPWLVKSEALHYAYALVMLIAFWVLRSGFVGRSYRWWMAAFCIQSWHHVEHALLQTQAIVGHNLFDSPTPMSVAQLIVPRVELHLFYNTIVFIPMVLAMFYHMFPLPCEEAHQHCSCAWHPRVPRR